MQCTQPIEVPNKNGQFNNDLITVPCGKCIACLQNKRSEWSYRLKEEWKHSQSAKFITLTYNDESLPLGDYDLPTLHKPDLQLFNKRLRQASKRYWDKWSKWGATEPILPQMDSYYQKLQYVRKNGLKPLNIRFYAVGEYGSKTNRPHYHGIYFNVPDDVIANVENIWGNGQIDVGECNEASIHYLTKYMINRPDYKGAVIEQPFSTMSRRPGIGHAYIDEKRTWHHKNYEEAYIQNGKFKQKMPRYFKDKLFTEFEKTEQKRKAAPKIEQSYSEKIERLKKRGLNPDEYQELALKRWETLIKEKSKSLDT